MITTVLSPVNQKTSLDLDVSLERSRPRYFRIHVQNKVNCNIEGDTRRPATTFEHLATHCCHFPRSRCVLPPLRRAVLRTAPTAEDLATCCAHGRGHRAATTSEDALLPRPRKHSNPRRGRCERPVPSNTTRGAPYQE